MKSKAFTAIIANQAFPQTKSTTTVTFARWFSARDASLSIGNNPLSRFKIDATDRI
jgi:hypothetical protein